MQDKRYPDPEGNQVLAGSSKSAFGLNARVTGLRSSCWPAVFLPTTEGRSRATYRRGGGSRQERQDASTGDDDVVHHLWDEVDRVVDEDDVLIAVHKIHHRLGGVAEMEDKSWTDDTKIQIGNWDIIGISSIRSCY